jgi:hypothetical protein
MGLGEYFPRFGSRANVHQRHLFVLAGGAQCSCHIRDPSKAAKTHHGPSSSDIPVGSIVTRGTSARNPPSQVAIHHVLRNRPLSISGPSSWRPRISGLPLLNKGKGSICELYLCVSGWWCWSWGRRRGRGWDVIRLREMSSAARSLELGILRALLGPVTPPRRC